MVRVGDDGWVGFGQSTGFEVGWWLEWELGVSGALRGATVPHLLILRVPVLVVRERGSGTNDVEKLRALCQEFAVRLHLRGFPPRVHRDYAAMPSPETTNAYRTNLHGASPRASCSGKRA